MYTVKKVTDLEPGGQLPISPWPGIIKLFPASGRVWLVTSRLAGTGKPRTFFTVYALRWLVTDWHNKSPKTLIYRG
jgi:hypothetical protein